MDKFTSHTIELKGQRTRYYEGGSKSGTPLIFVHGWPDLAETWKHQLSYFNNNAYRVIALDMRGYGGSSSPADKRAYSLEILATELVDFCHQLEIKNAIWVAHDWGCAVVSALAAHYPELCIGLALISVPYRSLELGVTHLINSVNREIYPATEYPHGQWSYQKYYEQEPEVSVQQLSSDLEKVTKLFHSKGDPSLHGQPARTSRVLENGGYFGGNISLIPDVPLSATVLDEDLLNSLVISLKEHGFFPPTAYYLNHDANEEYTKSEKNHGVLQFPVLFIDTKYDAVCSVTTTPKMAEIQKKFCENLTEVSVDAAHWGMLERPEDVNQALDHWLSSRF